MQLEGEVAHKLTLRCYTWFQRAGYVSVSVVTINSRTGRVFADERKWAEQCSEHCVPSVREWGNGGMG